MSSGRTWRPEENSLSHTFKIERVSLCEYVCVYLFVCVCVFVYARESGGEGLSQGKTLSKRKHC